MSYTKHTAPLIFSGDGEVWENTVVITDKDGTILALEDIQNHDAASIIQMEGALVPGFINTHCHLELSHMKGLVPTGTMLIPFITQVVKYRDFPQEAIDEAIIKADREMYERGIAAVGDISNKADTFSTKEKSKIKYHTFVEMFDFLNPTMTAGCITQYEAVYDQHHKTKDKFSYVPHAPYTVSPSLFEFINSQNEKHDITVSIHNQETKAENDLFLTKQGEFIDFYASFGIDLKDFKATGKNSIHYALAHMDSRKKTLFVHNTMCTDEDIQSAIQWNENTYFSTCANANLYIENAIPKYTRFINANAKMTIGTDSLTSNWQLCIFEEIKTIYKYCSYIDIPTIITWACANGAKALGFDDELGTISVGKKPGLVLCPIYRKEKSYHLGEGYSKRII
jgi:aminodeoxyfutalosine deaminase